MSTGSTQDRRKFAQDKIAEMANLPGSKQVTALRQIAAGVLGFTSGRDSIIAVDNPQLPSTANVVGTLTNEFGPDYTAVHFDLSTQGGTRSYVPNARIQAANRVVQQYAGEERYPLLIFTLPGNSGVQFVTGNPSPNNRDRLLDVIRVTAYWDSLNRTTLDCLERVGNAIVNGEPPQRAFRTGFNVQPITDEFFKAYKEAYDKAVNQLADSIERTDAEQFTQTLFNRLLFVHFVSRKGWLRFNGSADYLNALWRDYQASPGETNFYLHRLSHLFFAGLNNPQSLDLMRDNPVMHSAIGDVPFLNGGLFEQTPLDDQAANGAFTVLDEAIAPLLAGGQESGLFNRYNFTVMEATPLDTEVAVDPEMLGKLFEETVNERHSNGAYYTPRPVVAFMCREAIKGYLSGKAIAGLDDAKIADLVDRRNPDAITPMQAPEIYEVVKNMKAVDPACGSGAFLLGMIQEILALNDSLFRAGHTAESLYQQKLDIITNNIYGADKDALAVSTAMLRLWLSLAVDYDGDGLPDPLPNLDLKLVAGDTIAGPNPQQFDLTLQSIVNSGLRDDIAAYTTAYGQQKAELKQRVDDTRAQLRSNLQGAAPAGVVEWRIDFADVMLNGGFDVVIANPPYVRQEEITPKTYKDSLAKQYATAVTLRSDLYCYFYARGLQLLRDGGMHVFVCSNSWLDVGYGAKLQEHLLKTAHVRAVYESAVQRQFATADINTVISVIRKGGAIADGDLTQFVSLRADFDAALSDPASRREITQTRSGLRAAGASGRKFVGDKWGGKYLRAPDIYHAILDKCADKLVRLGDVATVRRGVTTGANDFFYLTAERIAEFGIEAECCRPVMTTPQESRSIAVDPTTLPKRLFMCHDDRDALAGTGALAYIKWGETQGFHTRTSVKSRRRWYDLGERNTTQLAMNYLIDTTARTFYVDGSLLFGDNFQELYGNAVSSLQLCAALNSTVSQLMFNIYGRANFGGGLMKIQTFEIESLRIVNPYLLPEPDAAVFNAADWDVLTPSAARRRIDGAVYDTLGLTAGERDAVYAGVSELVGNRRRRARSMKGSANDAQEQAVSKTEFRVVPNHSDFVPGVDPNQIKQILYEMDVEDYLRKSAQ